MSVKRKVQGNYEKRSGDGPMDLFRSAAEKDERLVTYFGSSEIIGKIFDRFDRNFPEEGINHIPATLDHYAGTEEYQKVFEELSDFTFPGLPAEMRKNAFRFFIDELEKLTVSDIGSWCGQEMRDFKREDGKVDKVFMLAATNAVFHEFEFNGKLCFVCECESMYNNSWVVDGRRINLFGPYGSPKLISIGHYGENERVVVDHMVGIQRMDHAMSCLPSSEPVAIEMFSDQGDVIRSGFVTLETVPAEDNYHRSSAGVRFGYSDGREEFLSVNQLIELECDARRKRMDEIRCNSVAPYLSPDGGIDKPFDEVAYFDAIHRAYGQASPTREVIGGNFAKDFVGEAHWSRALDFPVSGFPEFIGLRYIDFKDCTNVHVLLKDGNSLPMEDLGQKKLVDVKLAMDGFLRRNQTKKSQVKM